MEIVTDVLAFAHVLSAIAWLGGGLLFGFLIAPRLAKVSLSSSREFFVVVVPGVIRFFQIVAGLTIVFGVALLYWLDHEGDITIGFSNAQGSALTIGIAVAIVAFVLSEAVTVPAFHRVVELNRKMSADGSGVPPELPRSVRKAGMLSLVTLILLLITVGLMVASGFA